MINKKKVKIMDVELYTHSVRDISELSFKLLKIGKRGHSSD